MKKAQSGSNAAILVGLMTLAIILYILFLPPDVRQDLLDGNTSGTNDGLTEDSLNRTLLDEQPGRIDYLKYDYRDHELPSFRLYSIESGEVIKEQATVYSKNSAFQKNFATLTFPSKPGSKNYLLSFNVAKSSGRLIILLNGQEIFNNKLDVGSPKPIELSADLLQESNTLEFKVSDVGIAIWNSNEYALSNVQITADYTDTTNSASRLHFYVSAEEKNNLERTTLFFYPRCDEATVDRLMVSVNDYPVYEQIADCGINTNVPLNPEYIKEGENTVHFSTTRGSYLVDSIRIRNYLKIPLNPIYYFDVSSKYFEKIDDNNPVNDVLKSKYDVVLTLKFANQDNKKGIISLNGYDRYSFDTNKLTYNFTLDSDVISGANAIELVPRTSLEILDLKVEVKDHK